MKRLVFWAILSCSLFLSCRACHREEEQPPAQAAVEAPVQEQQPQAEQKTAVPEPSFEESQTVPGPQSIPMTPGAVIPLTGSAKKDEFGWAKDRRDQQVQAALHQLYLYQQQTMRESSFTTMPAPPLPKEQGRVPLKKGAPPPTDLVPAAKK